MPTQQKKPPLKIASLIQEETPNTEHLPSSLRLMGPREGAPRMLITRPHHHRHHSPALWFIFLWRSIDFLLFSLPLIPGSVSSVALYRGAIIQGLITAPLAAYLLPGDSLFKPLPNDLGKLTCSTSQGCGAPLMSEGVAPTQGLLVLPKNKREARKGPATATDASHIQAFHTSAVSIVSSCRWQSQVQRAGGSEESSILIKMSWTVVSEPIWTGSMSCLCLWFCSSLW